MERIKVAMADDHLIICNGMEKIINSHTDMRMIFTANSGKQLLQILKETKDTKELPDVILLDIEMPEMNGIETLSKIKAKFPALKIIMLSYHDEPHYVIHLIENGAVGYIQKSCEADEVVLTIRKVISNGRYFNDQVMELIHERLTSNLKLNEKYDFNGQHISNNDIKILELICLQKTTKEIAEYMNLSHRTIENHRTNIMRKANVDNVVGLVLYAISKGIFIPK